MQSLTKALNHPHDLSMNASTLPFSESSIIKRRCVIITTATAIWTNQISIGRSSRAVLQRNGEDCGE
ncbi:hypothetical protein Bca4012_035975 [Brassica carinata]